MDTKTSSQLLDEISVITRKNLALIEENFNSLTDTQLSWRKDKNSWNINEIFAHLNEYARYYHKTIAEKIKNTQDIGLKLYTDYFLQFQLAGIILLVAMIGVIILSQRDKVDRKKQDVWNQITTDPKDRITIVNK
jgi:hypothetical protein